MEKASKKSQKMVARKSREKYMNKLKESILNNAKKGGGDTANGSNETTGATNTATTPATTIRSNDTYFYGVDMLAVLAIGACVFFVYNTFLKNKKQAHEKKDQPPKRRHML